MDGTVFFRKYAILACFNVEQFLQIMKHHFKVVYHLCMHAISFQLSSFHVLYIYRIFPPPFLWMTFTHLSLPDSLLTFHFWIFSYSFIRPRKKWRNLEKWNVSKSLVKGKNAWKSIIKTYLVNEGVENRH